MKTRPFQDSVEILAPAKVNLFLELHSRRNDGFHELETVMLTVSIFDALWMSPSRSERIDFSCRWHGRPLPLPERLADSAGEQKILAGPGNLACKALESLRRVAGVRHGARVLLSKSIPWRSGLGGGSSDAAAALLAANQVWGLHWPRARLQEIAAGLGSDVPMFLSGGTVRAGGRGERLEGVQSLLRPWLVVAHPPAGLSTAEVYRKCQVPADPRSAVPLIQALRNGSFSGLARGVFNRLEPFADRLNPWIGILRNEFRRLGCAAQQMSGSGSSYFGVFPGQRAARRAAARLRSRLTEVSVYCCRAVGPHYDPRA